MASVTYNLNGDKALAKTFKRLGSRAVITAAQAGIRRGASIISKSAKKIVHREARESGHLERSIGVAVRTNYKTASVSAEIGPRVSYAAVATKGRRAILPIAIGQDSRSHPAVYGIYIETGRHGRMFRRKGGVHYMRRALDSSDSVVIREINDAIAKKIKSIASKRGV